MARLTATYRQVFHRAGRWLRQGRTAVVWGVQIAVYPLYAAIQGVRLGYRRLRAAGPWQRVWATLRGQDLPEPVAADLPIRALLSVVQPPVSPAATVRPSGLCLVSAYGPWLKRSRAGAVLTPGGWHRLPLTATLRGIACDREGRHLVLVLHNNDIFDHLTEDQQQRLQRAIVLMLAEYAHSHRCAALDQTLRHPWLPLPVARPQLWPALRWLPRSLRWFQASALAVATNLFGEAPQQRATQAIALWRQALYLDEHQGSDEPLTAARALSPHQALALAPYRSSPAYGPEGSVAAVALALAGAETAAARLTPELLAADGAGWPAAERPLLDEPTALEASVTQISYVDSPLVVGLRGLDWVLYQIETWLLRLAAWLKRHW